MADGREHPGTTGDRGSGCGAGTARRAAPPPAGGCGPRRVRLRLSGTRNARGLPGPGRRADPQRAAQAARRPERLRGAGSPPAGNAAVADNAHVQAQGLIRLLPGIGLRRQVPAPGPPNPSRVGIIVWCPFAACSQSRGSRGRLRNRIVPFGAAAREPGEVAADITDWTALAPDDFFAALKTACRAGSVPAAAVPGDRASPRRRPAPGPGPAPDPSRHRPATTVGPLSGKPPSSP